MIYGPKTAIRALTALAVAAVMAAPALAQSKYQGQTLNIASFGGKIDETFQKAMAGFEDKFGVTLNWVPGNTTQNAAKAVASKGSPEFDVVMLDDVQQANVSAMGDVLAKLDPAIVTNYDQLRPQAKFPGMDGVPLGFNFTGIFYNTEEFAKNGWAKPESWEDLFRPEFCGKVGMMHPNVSYTINLMVILAGNDLSKVPATIDKIATLKDCVATLEPSSAKMEEKIQLGEYVTGVHGVVRVIPLKAGGFPVDFVVPKEGSALSSTTAAVALGGNEALAQEFINWIISPEAQQILMENAYYIPASSQVMPSAELLALGMPDPSTLENAIDPDRVAVSENRRAWSEQLERAMAR